MDNDDHVWESITPDETACVLKDLSIPWWISGGWAIDLFAGRQTRLHDDMDIQILRKDQSVIRKHLESWDIHKTKQPGLKPWTDGEYLTAESGINSVWCRRTDDSPWCIEVMFMESDGDEWFFRRHPAIRGPISSLGRRTSDGIPFISPEIQLLFKANREMKAKDNRDFAIALPLLDREKQLWLSKSLTAQFPEGHEWISRINSMNLRFAD